MAVKNSKKNTKSSKTDHVLNLIGMASAPQKQEPEEEISEPASEPAKVADPPAPAPVASYPTEHLAPPILEVARTNHEALSETIHQALSQSLEEELAKNLEQELEESASLDTTEMNAEEAPASQSQSDNNDLQADSPQQLQTEVPLEEPPVSQEAESPAILQEDKAQETLLTETPADSSVPQKEPIAAPTPASPAAQTPPPALTSTQLLSDGAVLVNVMQILVEEAAPRYLEMFHVCSCSRCVADVKALALTQLPAKYVVLEESKKDSMLSFYRYSYQSLLTIELTKACSAVIQCPHHMPDLSL